MKNLFLASMILMSGNLLAENQANVLHAQIKKANLEAKKKAVLQKESNQNSNRLIDLEVDHESLKNRINYNMLTTINEARHSLNMAKAGHPLDKMELCSQVASAMSVIKLAKDTTKLEKLYSKDTRINGQIHESILSLDNKISEHESIIGAPVEISIDTIVFDLTNIQTSLCKKLVGTESLVGEGPSKDCTSVTNDSKITIDRIPAGALEFRNLGVRAL